MVALHGLAQARQGLIHVPRLHAAIAEGTDTAQPSQDLPRTVARQLRDIGIEQGGAFCDGPKLFASGPDAARKALVHAELVAEDFKTNGFNDKCSGDERQASCLLFHARPRSPLPTYANARQRQVWNPHIAKDSRARIAPMIVPRMEPALVNELRSLSFTIPGRLGSWQRAARDIRKGSGFSFTPDKMRSDQAMIKHFAVEAMRASCKTPLVGALKLVVQTWRQPPKSWSLKKQAAAKWITTRPDFDNTLKLIADALNKVAYDDDAQIAVGAHIKRYSPIRADCVIIDLEELESAP